MSIFASHVVLLLKGVVVDEFHSVQTHNQTLTEYFKDRGYVFDELVSQGYEMRT